MIDENQHEVPSGADPPARDWHNRLSASIRDTLTFSDLDAANAWAASSPLLAVDGRHAWIEAENAVYVRAGGSWQLLWPTVATGTATVAITGAQTALTPFLFGRALPFTPSMVTFQSLSTSSYLRGATFQISGAMTPTQVLNLVITYPAVPQQLGNLTVGWVAYA